MFNKVLAFLFSGEIDNDYEYKDVVSLSGLFFILIALTTLVCCFPFGGNALFPLMSIAAITVYGGMVSQYIRPPRFFINDLYAINPSLYKNHSILKVVMTFCTILVISRVSWWLVILPSFYLIMFVVNLLTVKKNR